MTCTNHKVKLGSNEDRISSLPDGVLCHMLSFLPTKYSVRTTVLSTRWKHLFTFVPNLDFKYDSTNPDSSAVDSTLSFIHFVSSVFIIYNVYRMNKFGLDFYHFGHPPTHYPIFSWISSAILRQVQEIDITIYLVVPRTLPLDLFTCKSLTSLRLWGKFNVVLPQTVCLPFLRICHLGRVRFNEKSAHMLFRSCPVLEQLSLISCDMGEGVEVLNISAPALKRFYIHVCEDQFQIVFNVPKLTSLEYSAEGLVKNEFSGLESFKSMVEAVISYEQESNIEDSVSVELVRGICHVSQLCLYCGPIEAFQRSGHSLPTFNYLTRLTLGPMSNLSSKLLSNLLDNSPHLEFLSFNQRYADELDGADQNKYVLPGHVSACVSLHLKEVEFRHFNMLEFECTLIRYFLKNAKNLRKMHIRSTLSWDEKFEISSTACQIVFDSDGIEE